MSHNVVGARELKTRLGTYLRRVREGRTVVVTERGRPVAELRPVPAGAGLDATLQRLESVGVVSRGTGQRLATFRAIASRGGSVAAAVLEDREDRF